MKRRDFLRASLPAAVLPTVINGFSLKSFAADSPLAKMLGTGTDNDHVLVITGLYYMKDNTTAKEQILKKIRNGAICPWLNYFDTTGFPE